MVLCISDIVTHIVTHRVDSLKEGTTYLLRLMAVTCEGKGARTRWIEVSTRSSQTPFAGGAATEHNGPCRLVFNETPRRLDNVPDSTSICLLGVRRYYVILLRIFFC